MPTSGWKQLMHGAPWFQGEGKYYIAAYSEFMPPPRLGQKPYPYAKPDTALFAEDDPWGWHVTEYEESQELRPGLGQVAEQVVRALVHLGQGRADLVGQDIGAEHQVRRLALQNALRLERGEQSLLHEMVGQVRRLRLRPNAQEDGDGRLERAALPQAAAVQLRDKLPASAVFDGLHGWPDS